VEVDGQNQHNSNHPGFICPRSFQRIQQVALSPFAPMPGTLEGAAPRLFRPMYAGARGTRPGKWAGLLAQLKPIRDCPCATVTPFAKLASDRRMRHVLRG
jgi:hypothetical protein